MRKLWSALILAAFLFTIRPARAESPTLVSQAFLAGVKLGCYRAVALEREKTGAIILTVKDCQAIAGELAP